MGIYVNNRPIGSIYKNGRAIKAVYHIGRLVWSKQPVIDIILSCYYNGYWMDEYPWTDDTPWTD